VNATRDHEAPLRRLNSSLWNPRQQLYPAHHARWSLPTPLSAVRGGHLFTCGAILLRVRTKFTHFRLPFSEGLNIDSYSEYSVLTRGFAEPHDVMRRPFPSFFSWDYVYVRLSLRRLLWTSLSLAFWFTSNGTDRHLQPYRELLPRWVGGEL